MKKQILSMAVIASLSFTSLAQTTIPNGDFENWLSVGQNTERPTNWSSNKSGRGFASAGPKTCSRDTNGYTGMYCAKVTTAALGAIIVNGSLTTGVVVANTFSAAEGYLADVDTVRNAFSGRPDSIVFWYKYTQVGTDYPNVQVRLHVGSVYNPEAPVNNNHPDSSVNIIGRALWNGPASNQATWARASVPMVYADSRTPQYIFVTTTSSGNLAAPGTGSTLWLDNIQAVYNTTAVSEINAEPIHVYWNGNKLMADLTNESLNGASIQIMNIEGQLVLDAPLKPNTMNAVETTLPSGVFLYQISSDTRNVIGKIGKQ